MINIDSNMIDFNKPYVAKNQKKYVIQAMQSNHISGDGPFTKKCHRLLENEIGVSKALLTTNCTHALEMSALLLDLKIGDEVIVPSFTFVSTANAFVLRGARPVFVDIRPDTLNIDESRIEESITEHTKAIYVVHYAGVGCEMDEIIRIANKYGLFVVEDNAHGLFGKYKNRNLGTFGCMAAQSFHETKNISCGEGGALLINQPEWIEQAEIIREKGTNRSKFFRGQIDKYTWVNAGSSYLPSDILAAVLLSHLEERELIQSKRKDIWNKYHNGLVEWAKLEEIRLPEIPAHCQQSYHMFYMIFPNLEIRQRFIGYLRENGIYAVFHYIPLHTSKMGNQFGYFQGNLPVTESISDRLLRLPFYNDLKVEDQKKVINIINKFKT